MVRPFSLLIKPASADCNLACRYCFYLGHQCSFYPESRRHRMCDAVLEQVVRSYMETAQPTYQFGWQGGEPTLMGVEFFKRVIELQKRHGHPGAVVGNGLQTNATLITAEIAGHFAAHNFLLGVSLDGPKRIHDTYRQTLDGTGTYDDVWRGIAHLRDHHAEFNILTLVSNANVDCPAEVYGFLCDNGFLFHQYIPCVEPDADREVQPFSIGGEKWGEFLCKVFDLWYEHDARRVSVRLFDSVLGLLVDEVRNMCAIGTNCCQYFVVEYNGDVFPCDFFVEKRLRLGSVTSDSWSALQASPIYQDFGRQKRRWHRKCEVCRFSWVCSGDCLKHRLCSGGGDPGRLSHLCAGWEMFYEHTLPRFRALAEQIQRERQASRVPTGSGKTAWVPGRNDPCPCGSGRKFKKCCGRA